MRPRNWPVYRQLTGTDRRGLGAAAKSDHPRQARTTTADKTVKSVCPYCAVGCGQRVYVQNIDGRDTVTQIEGDPDSPVSRGRLCPKGSASKQLVTHAGRQQHVLYRRPYGTRWEPIPLDQAMDMVAERVKVSRDRNWQDTDEHGQRNAMKKNEAEDFTFVPVPSSRGRSDHDTLGVDHFTHDAAAAVGGSHQDWVES